MKQIKPFNVPLPRNVRFEVEDDDIGDWDESFLGHKEPEDTNK